MDSSQIGRNPYLRFGKFGHDMCNDDATEVLVNGNKAALIRPRQQLEEIWKSEQMPHWLK